MTEHIDNDFFLKKLKLLEYATFLEVVFISHN